MRSLIKQPAVLALVVWFSAVWSWALFTDMLDLAGSKFQGYILAVFVLTVNVFLCSIIAWQMIRCVRFVQRRYSPTWFLILGLPLFALLDFLVAWIVALIWIGPEGSLDNVLPMGSLALPLLSTPFKFAARFVGFWGLAAFLWMTIFLVLQKKTRKLTLVPIGVLTILSIAGWGIYRAPNGVPVQVTLVSETLKQRIPAIDPKDTDLVVFPEYGLERNNNKNLHERIRRTKDNEPRTYFVGSEQIYKPNVTGHINNMMFGNTTEGITDRESKYRLIPGGEDLPYVVRILLRATGQRNTLDYFSYAKGVIKGDHQLEPVTVSQDVVVATAVCSSIISPEDYRAFANNNATLFTNSASLSIFQGSPLFAWQQKNLARFMAVANARYFLQSANGASAYALDASGKQIAEAKGHNSVHVLATTNSRRTVYTYVGEWLVFLGVMCLTGLGILLVRQRHRKSS